MLVKSLLKIAVNIAFANREHISGSFFLKSLSQL